MSPFEILMNILKLIDNILGNVYSGTKILYKNLMAS
jgi:hypothetical protein